MHGQKEYDEFNDLINGVDEKLVDLSDAIGGRGKRLPGLLQVLRENIKPLIDFRNSVETGLQSKKVPEFLRRITECLDIVLNFTEGDKKALGPVYDSLFNFFIVEMRRISGDLKNDIRVGDIERSGLVGAEADLIEAEQKEKKEKEKLATPAPGEPRRIRAAGTGVERYASVADQQPMALGSPSKEDLAPTKSSFSAAGTTEFVKSPQPAKTVGQAQASSVSPDSDAKLAVDKLRREMESMKEKIDWAMKILGQNIKQAEFRRAWAEKRHHRERKARLTEQKKHQQVFAGVIKPELAHGDAAPPASTVAASAEIKRLSAELAAMRERLGKDEQRIARHTGELQRDTEGLKKVFLKAGDKLEKKVKRIADRLEDGVEELERKLDKERAEHQKVIEQLSRENLERHKAFEIEIKRIRAAEEENRRNQIVAMNKMMSQIEDRVQGLEGALKGEQQERLEERLASREIIARLENEIKAARPQAQSKETDQAEAIAEQLNRLKGALPAATRSATYHHGSHSAKEGGTPKKPNRPRSHSR